MNKPNITSLLRKSSLVLGFAAFTSLPLQAADPASILPDEPVAYAEMDSAGLNKLSEHPVGKLIPVKQIEDLMMKATGQTKEDREALEKMVAEEMGMSMEELEKKFGKFALSVHDLKVPANPTPENVEVEFSAAGEMDGDEAFGEKYLRTIIKLIAKQAKKQGGGDMPDFDELLKKAEEHIEHSTAEHGGAKIHIYKIKESDETKEAPGFLKEWAFSIHGKMLLVSSGQEGVEEMIDRVKSGGAGSLADSAMYKADHEKAGKTVALASMNLETILGLVEKYALPEADTGDIDVEKLWKGLGADKLKSAVLALGATDSAVDFAALLTHSSKPGLFKIFALPGSGKAPAFLPKDAISASYQQFDLDETLDNVAKLLGELNPAWGGLIDMGLGMAQSQTGVDIRKEFLANLGPEIWTVTGKATENAKPKEDGPLGASEALMMNSAISKGIYGIRVKDSKAVGNALKSLINATGQAEGLFEDQEYQGYTIRKIKAAPAPMSIGYVLTDEWLLLNINDQEALEQILGNLKKEATDGFFSDKNITGLLDGMRGGEASVTVTDVGAMLSALSDFAQMASEASGVEEAKQIPWEDIKKLAKLPLWAASKTWLEDTVTEVRFRVGPKE